MDPLDGTVNYTHLFPMFCVSIAFVVRTIGNPMSIAGDVRRAVGAATLFERQVARSPEIVFFPVYLAESSLKLGEAGRVARAVALLARLRGEGRLFPEDERKLAALTTLTARR